MSVGQFTTTIDQVALGFTAPSNLPAPKFLSQFKDKYWSAMCVITRILEAATLGDGLPMRVFNPITLAVKS